MMLPMLPQDKANHFIYGLIIFGLFKILLGRYSVKTFKRRIPLIGIIVCSLFGISKEIYDLLNKDTHTPDIYDAAITILGGLIGLLIIKDITNINR